MPLHTATAKRIKSALSMGASPPSIAAAPIPPIFSFSAKFARAAARARASVAVPAVLVMFGCSSGQLGDAGKVGVVGAAWEKVERPAAVVEAAPVVMSSGLEVEERTGPEAVNKVTGSSPNYAAFAPFRLAFTAVRADAVLRRLGEWAGVKYVADDAAMSSAVMSVDVEVTSWADIYSLVGWIANATGQSVKWRGSLAVFNKKAEGSSSPADGFLVRSAKLTDELRDIARDRFSVSCGFDGGVTVCAGSVLDVEDARKFFAALEGAYGRVRHQVVVTEVDVAAVVVALGVEAHVVAAKVGGGRWLVASADDRLLDLVIEALESATGGDCITESYRAQHVAVDDLVPLLSSALVKLCAAPLAVKGSVFWSATAMESVKARALLVEADRPEQLARLLVVIAQENRSNRFGLSTDLDIGIPRIVATGGVSLLVNMSRAAGWRTLEVTTSGKSKAGVNQSDRIQGDTTITNSGSQIIARQDRVVGLTVTFDGLVTRSGFRGNLSITDSVLDGEVERGASCDGFVTVDFDLIARVCSYQRADRSGGLSNTGLNATRSRESFTVLVALLQHERAAVDTLRLAFARPGQHGATPAVQVVGPGQQPVGWCGLDGKPAIGPSDIPAAPCGAPVGSM